MRFPAGPIPRVRSGPAGLVNVLNTIIDAINRTRTITGDGTDIAVKEVGNNLVVSLVGGKSRVVAQRFVIKSIEMDRLICRKVFHDESEDTTDVTVAKPFGSRDGVGDGGFEVDQIILGVIASGGTGIQDGEAWVEWIVIGGAGSPVVRMRIMSVQADYLTCRTWDGATAGTDDILVAKLTTERANAAHGGYAAGNEIWAFIPAGGTGVSDGGNPVQYMMLSRGLRPGGATYAVIQRLNGVAVWDWVRAHA
jgi:hypothetical protein